MKYKLAVLILLLFYSCKNSAQNSDFVYVDIPEALNFKSFFFELSQDFVDITNYLPKDYIRDGTVDYTVFIQKGIDENKKILLPNFPVLINQKGLELKSNSIIFFQENSWLIMKPTKEAKYSVLLLNSVENVEIYNASLIGDRKEAGEKKGEWGIGIRINGSKNIHIHNVNIKDMWGDGIYISRFKDRQSENIFIEKGVIDNSRRNGISIISGKDVTIEDVTISNTNGTNPASGIVIEPNRVSDVLENIKLNNISTFNNHKEGIVISLRRLLNKSQSPNIGIEIKNHQDFNSRYALRFSKMKKKKETKPIKGYVNISDSQWFQLKRPEAVLIQEPEILPNVTFRNISLDDDKEKIKNRIKTLRNKHANIFLY